MDNRPIVVSIRFGENNPLIFIIKDWEKALVMFSKLTQFSSIHATVTVSQAYEL
jgi:hypothetical protein